MAIYRKEPVKKPSRQTEKPAETNENSRLGRGLDSLTGDNTPAEKKPLVVRRGLYEGPRSTLKERTSLRDKPGVGGRVVIRTESLPDEPLRSARSARKGTTVLVRTERTATAKHYKPNKPLDRRYDVRPGEPIVIDPRKKK